jgi:putative MATE family efflux protein
VLFTLPLLIGNVFQQAYQFTDTAVVGRLLGVNSLAAVGASGSLCFLLLGFTFGASGGLAIPTAKAFGAGDLAQMRRYVAAGVKVSAFIALAITLIGSVAARLLLRLLNTPPELMHEATIFLAVSFGGATVTMAYNFLAATIRALGDSRTPLYFLVIACIINAGLVVLFIGAFHWGVGGAAAATVTAQAISALLCLILVKRKMPILLLHREDFRSRPGEMGEVARIGLTMGFNMSVIAIGATILQYAINGLGATSVAAYTVAVRMDQMALAPLGSFGVAVSTFNSQNRGAKQWRRIRMGVFRAGLLVIGVAIVMGILLIAFSSQITRLFVEPGETEVIAMVHQYFLISGCLYVFLAMLFLLRSAIQGLGLTLVPTLAGFMELAMRAITGIVLVSHFGFIGACWASPLAWLGALVPITTAWVILRRRLIRAETSPTPGWEPRRIREPRPLREPARV